MLNLTPFGLKFLESNGINLNKNGDKIEAGKSIPRSKVMTAPETSSRTKHQTIDQLSGIVTSLIGDYYSQPEGIISNNGIKKCKKKIENYICKSEDGYLPGHRHRFYDLARQIVLVCGDTILRPKGEEIFSAIKRIMDRCDDNRMGPNTECW